MLSVAVVGMGALFPGAPTLEAFERNLREGRDAITEVPRGRWDPVFYDPTSSAVDRLYCKRGGFVAGEVSFDALAFGVMPVAAKGAEPDQLLCLDVAQRAMKDAGYDARPFARERAGVILGRGGYAGPGRMRLEQRVRTVEQVMVCLRALLPGVGDEDLRRVREELASQAKDANPDAAIGLVPNLAASRLAHHLDLAGPAFTVDAACASSLVAVDQACRELASGRCDLMLAGGVHLCHDESFWSVFCQLGALSRAQSIRPFDRKADGLLIGEGAGILVLKRLAEAERDGDRIYCVIRGAGVASDGRGASLMAPRVEGQFLALRRAWEEAGLEPSSVGLVEAHGTATPTGDHAELETLRRFFGEAQGDAPRPALGSVKSMIGHAMPAAGVAGFIKAALALHHRALLPTLHCDEPHELLAKTRFRTLAKEEPWEASGVRRAAVNAFGFGGIDAHVVLEEHAASRGRVTATTVAAPAIARFAAKDKEGLLAQLDGAHRPTKLEGAARLAVLDPTPERMARARTVVEKGRAWRGRESIWFTPSGLASEGGKVVFLFPGVDASFAPRVDDVAAHFGLPAPTHTVANNLEEVGLGIVGVNRLVHRVLERLGVEADFLAGHSIGEWSGMIAGGVLSEEALETFIAGLRPGTLEVPGVAFAAAGCGQDAAREAMQGLPEIDLSHDNCPHQVLLCGRDESIDVALARLRTAGVLCQKLPFRSGFHSRLFSDYLEPHRANVDRLPMQPSKKPLFSATVCTEYPDDPDAIRALTLEHLVRPVRFRELIEVMYARGARVFVQAGTGSLVSFVEDTLRGKAHLAISANVKDQTGLTQLRRLAAALFVEGVPVQVEPLFESWAGRASDESLASQTSSPRSAARAPVTLSLGVPLLRPTFTLDVGPAPHRPAPASPLAAEFASSVAPLPPPRCSGEVPALRAGDLAFEFAASLAAIARAEKDVMVALERPTPREAAATRVLSIDAAPELRDHAFFRQPPGWPVISDLHPVVPMTTSIELMKEAAEALVPERKVIAVEGVRAYKWLVVSTPVAAQIRATFDGKDRVAVLIEGYADCVCVLAPSYPEPPAADAAPLAGGRAAPISARDLYDDRWMFHGPAFQGVVSIESFGKDAIRGDLETPAARGALLDNAGQLFGYWVMQSFENDRLAMPVKIDRLRFFGPHPRPGERLTCTVRIRKHGAKEVIADLALDAGGQAWCVIEGWEDRRFDTDERLWGVMRYPERHLLAEPQPEGFIRFVDRYRSAPTRNQLARRFLGERERAEYESQGPRKQRSWLSGRIAAKDAVRDLLFKEGHAPVFPVEISIRTGDRGEPLATAPGGVEVRISIAHKDDIAVAMAARGRDVGIDVERVEPRPEGFAELSFTSGERRMIAADPDAALAMTFFWVAKEAAAKAEGSGLEGDPKRYEIIDRQGERVLVAGPRSRVAVALSRFGDYAIGWTLP